MLRSMAVFLFALATVGSSPARGQEALSPELEAVRAALAKYQDPVVAVHDGYFSTVGCIAVVEGGGEGRFPVAPGGMGVHFLNPANIGPTVDPSKPQVLIYEPDGDTLHLVAAEWFVPLATGVKERPVIFGRSFDGPMEGHHPIMPEDLHHYDLHVWLFKPNPAGIFNATNPDVDCSGAPYYMPEPAPRLVKVD